MLQYNTLIVVRGVTSPFYLGNAGLEEYLEQKLASISYTANASVIRTQQELDQVLLDIET